MFLAGCLCVCVQCLLLWLHYTFKQSLNSASSTEAVVPVLVLSFDQWETSTLGSCGFWVMLCSPSTHDFILRVADIKVDTCYFIFSLLFIFVHFIGECAGVHCQSLECTVTSETTGHEQVAMVKVFCTVKVPFESVGCSISLLLGQNPV